MQVAMRGDLPASPETGNLGSIRANIRIHRVFHDHEPDGMGGIKNVEKIEYSPGHSVDRGRIVAKVEDLEPDHSPGSRINDPHSALGTMKRQQWAAMLPAIMAFRRGEELEVQGTHLGLWSALDQRRAELIKQQGIRTIEELVNATEGDLIRIQSYVPDIRAYVDMGRRFLQYREVSKAAAMDEARENEVKLVKAQNETLQEQVNEMRTMLERFLSAQGRVNDDGTIEPPVMRRRRRAESDDTPDTGEAA